MVSLIDLLSFDKLKQELLTERLKAGKWLIKYRYSTRSVFMTCIYSRALSSLN
ncbi:hypothetical protein K080096A4_18380 [[Clostridium] innocuum]